MNDNSYQRINSALEKAQDHISKKEFKQAAMILKKLNEQYPKNIKIISASKQFNKAVKQERIQKLQDEAVLMMSKGAEEQAQYKLRQILEIDPSRTDLKDSLKKTHSEIMKDHHKLAARNRFIGSCLKNLFFLGLIAGGILLTIAIKTNFNLGKAEEFIEEKNYKQAKTYLNKSKLFFQNKKASLDKEIEDQVSQLIYEAENHISDKQFDRAISLLEIAKPGIDDPNVISLKIEKVKVEKENWKNYLAQKLKERNYALEVKQKCQDSYLSATEIKADIEAKNQWLVAKKLFENAQNAFSKEDYVSAAKFWDQSSIEFEKSKQLTQKIVATKNSKALCVQEKINVEGLLFDYFIDEFNKIALIEQEAQQLFANSQFELAASSWDQARKSYQDLLTEITQSTEYQKKLLMLERWKELNHGLVEDDVIKILGIPKYIHCSSDKAKWYYQEIPAIEIKGGKQVCIEPVDGYVEFKPLDIEEIHRRLVEARYAALNDANDSYTNAVIRENNRHESKERNIRRRNYSESSERTEDELKETKRHENRLEREKRTHLNLIAKINKRYNTKIRILLEGLATRSPNFLVSNWKTPDKMNLLQLHQAPDKIDYKPEEKWQIENHWRALKFNLEADDVHRALGMPATKKILGNEIIEYYDNQKYGFVVFSKRSNGRYLLEKWNEPLWIELKQELQISDTELANQVD